MHVLLFVAMILAPGEGWESKFFEDVRLHKGGPLVTIQVAWLEPEVVWTNSVMPAVVSVFEGKAGARKLIKSTKIGNLGSHSPKAFYYDNSSGTAFLSLPMHVGRRINRGIFIFEDGRPRLVLRKFGLNSDRLSQGVVLEGAWAKDVDYVLTQDDHPNLYVQRELKYDPAAMEFKPGQWKKFIFPPVSAELRGANGGHSFVVKLAKTYFELGDRKVEFNSNGRLTVGGLVAYGTDLPGAEDIRSHERNRGLFLEELKSFRAWVDGEELAIPNSLWETCFEPNLGTDPDPFQYLYAWISADGTRLVVKMLGSDAAGGYIVIWTLRPDGNHSRRFDWPP